MQRSSSMPACAACKHQRKKCKEGCVLAHLFPATKTSEFQAVHRVFGVSNVSKMVRGLNREEGESAVESLVWEALCWQKDPALGPYGEYKRLRDELALCGRSQSQTHLQPNQSHSQLQLHAQTHVAAQGTGSQTQFSVPLLQGGGGRSMGYKSMPNLIDWNHANHGICNNKESNAMNCMGSIVDSSPYNFSSLQKQEREIGSVVIMPHQQHSINGFNPQYYLSGNIPFLS